ncbi:hypothetical protein B0A54_09800 [Friedmanniomyces endolithicus]|uniref:MARVEL domain-containing protein n=1 Tax=Friedmanniomyces endolithicus TaxID=329885 RepID=A0A4U0UPE4_9PEZI|nr:hypothetical protein LTS09_007998 [Friedmanniomyces endolithicus]TKA37798.1 hypothetical protein B0A54_09800 [Friedmanniomyces endolithicus]
MVSARGGILRAVQCALYAIIFCCAAVILGIYAYFLSVLTKHHLYVSQYSRAVEGISAAAVIYLAFAVLLTCCLGGITGVAILAIILDLCFCAAMIAVAVLARDGAGSCKGYVRTPVGSGQTYAVAGNGHAALNLSQACRLNTAVFALAIIAAILFLLTAVMQILLFLNHKKEKSYGPSPSNNYTSGSGTNREMYAREDTTPGEMYARENPPAGEVYARKDTTAHPNTIADSELGVVHAGTDAGALAAHHHDMLRPSHDTGYTGSTVTAPANGNAFAKIDPQHHGGDAPNSTHGNLYSQPQDTGANPYGYETVPVEHTYQTGAAATEPAYQVRRNLNY